MHRYSDWQLVVMWRNVGQSIMKGCGAWKPMQLSNISEETGTLPNQQRQQSSMNKQNKEDRQNCVSNNTSSYKEWSGACPCNFRFYLIFLIPSRND